MDFQQQTNNYTQPQSYEQQAHRYYRQGIVYEDPRQQLYHPLFSSPDCSDSESDGEIYYHQSIQSNSNDYTVENRVQNRRGGRRQRAQNAQNRYCGNMPKSAGGYTAKNNRTATARRETNSIEKRTIKRQPQDDDILVLSPIISIPLKNRDMNSARAREEERKRKQKEEEEEQRKQLPSTIKADTSTPLGQFLLSELKKKHQHEENPTVNKCNGLLVPKLKWNSDHEQNSPSLDEGQVPLLLLAATGGNNNAQDSQEEDDQQKLPLFDIPIFTTENETADTPKEEASTETTTVKDESLVDKISRLELDNTKETKDTKETKETSSETDSSKATDIPSVQQRKDVKIIEEKSVDNASGSQPIDLTTVLYTNNDDSNINNNNSNNNRPNKKETDKADDYSNNVQQKKPAEKDSAQLKAHSSSNLNRKPTSNSSGKGATSKSSKPNTSQSLRSSTISSPIRYAHLLKARSNVNKSCFSTPSFTTETWDIGKVTKHQLKLYELCYQKEPSGFGAVLEYSDSIDEQPKQQVNELWWRSLLPNHAKNKDTVDATTLHKRNGKTAVKEFKFDTKSPDDIILEKIKRPFK